MSAIIPKIIHYVWCGPRPMPKAHRAFVEGWKRMLPGWTFMEWNDATIDFSSNWLCSAYVARKFNVVSDFVRMQVLLRHGGVYLDTDVELLKPLDPLLTEPAFLGIQTTGPSLDWLNGTVIGAPPGHRLIERVLDYLEHAMVPTWNYDAFTGPGLLTQTVLRERLAPEPMRDVLQRHPELTLFPTRWFYPYPWDGTYDPSCVTPDTVAVHHWEASWSGKGPKTLTSADLWRLRYANRLPRLGMALQRRAFIRARGRSRHRGQGVMRRRVEPGKRDFTTAKRAGRRAVDG
ncbi:glycosyltransferase [Elioraea rosea]|uniref:glycosyltransferase n=1 Tax=Elioraea rosea TaxID=2492390 RepID=UPI001181C812|nr:glycosyltransferase [Elioraea rosea]